NVERKNNALVRVLKLGLKLGVSRSADADVVEIIPQVQRELAAAMGRARGLHRASDLVLGGVAFTGVTQGHEAHRAWRTGAAAAAARPRAATLRTAAARAASARAATLRTAACGASSGAATLCSAATSTAATRRAAALCATAT